MLQIKIALYYRERRLCRGRRRNDNCCLGHADTSLPTEVLMESSWEWSILEARHHYLQWQRCPPRAAHKDLPTLPICPCELFVPLKAKQNFWDSMVPCCTPSRTPGCFYPSKRLKILQIQCSTENFTPVFCKHRARQGGHSHLVTPAPFPCTCPQQLHFAARWHPITLFL